MRTEPYKIHVIMKTKHAMGDPNLKYHHVELNVTNPIYSEQHIHPYPNWINHQAKIHPIVKAMQAADWKIHHIIGAHPSQNGEALKTVNDHIASQIRTNNSIRDKLNKMNESQEPIVTIGSLPHHKILQNKGFRPSPTFFNGWTHPIHGEIEVNHQGDWRHHNENGNISSDKGHVSLENYLNTLKEEINEEANIKDFSHAVFFVPHSKERNAYGGIWHIHSLHSTDYSADKKAGHLFYNGLAHRTKVVPRKDALGQMYVTEENENNALQIVKNALELLGEGISDKLMV